MTRVRDRSPPADVTRPGHDITNRAIIYVNSIISGRYYAISASIIAQSLSPYDLTCSRGVKQ